MEKKYFKYNHRIYLAKTTANRPDHCVLWAVPTDRCRDPEYYFIAVCHRNGSVEYAYGFAEYPWDVSIGARRLVRHAEDHFRNVVSVKKLDAKSLQAYHARPMKEELKKYMSELGRKGQQKLKEKYSPEQIRRIRSDAAKKGYDRKRGLSTAKGLHRSIDEIKISLTIPQNIQEERHFDNKIA